MKGFIFRLVMSWIAALVLAIITNENLFLCFCVIGITEILRNLSVK